MKKTKSLFAIFFILILAGCASKELEHPIYTGEKLNKIAILPVQRLGEDKAGTITCPISEKDFDAQPTTKEQGRTFNDMLVKGLSGDKRFFEVTDERCYLYFNAIINENIKTNHLKIIQQMGRELGADAVLYSRLFRFVEREGGNYGATRPASVAFSIHLIRISDGAILWKWTFDETQKAITDNILDLDLYRRSGIKWLTANELAAYGISKALEDLNRFLPK